MKRFCNQSVYEIQAFTFTGLQMFQTEYTQKCSLAIANSLRLSSSNSMHVQNVCYVKLFTYLWKTL